MSDDFEIGKAIKHHHDLTKVVDAVTSPQATRPLDTGLSTGCEFDPSGLHECGVDEDHKLCVCASCGANWPNPEWHESAAQPAAGTTPLEPSASLAGRRSDGDSLEEQ